METSELKLLQSELEDYYFVTVMRDPAQRLLSGYLNKINRYCKRFARPIYLWGKLRQFLSGPNAWGDINCCNRYMRQLVSFERFVAGLERHGTDWDRHFSPQTALAETSLINYQEVIYLEVLDSALTDLLAKRGLEPEVLDRLHNLPRFNSTKRDTVQAPLTDSLLKRITALYKADYEFLDRWQIGSKPDFSN